MSYKYNLKKFREDAYQFIKKIEDIYYRNWIGVLETIEIGSVFKEYKHLFTKEAIKFLKKQKGNNDEETQQLRHLLGCFLGYHMEYKTTELRQEILNTESNSFIKFYGEKIFYRSIMPRVLTDKNRQTRLELFRRRRGIQLRKLNPLKRQLVETYLKMPKTLGYSDYISLCEKVQGHDLHQFAEEMEEVLDESEDLYIENLQYFLQKDLGIKRENANITDVFYIRRITQYNDYFPKDKMLYILKKTLGGMGFDLDKQQNITFDTELRPSKIPRACVSAIDPPGDVRLTVYPSGGYQDYNDIFHETGHAEHFAHDRKDLEMEYKYWGDRGFTEGTAYLFQNLTTNPDWLSSMIGMRNKKEFLKRTAFNNLLALRRLISSFLYELKLFSRDSLAALPTIYARIMGRGHGVQYPGVSYLDMDTEFYSAGYVRARIFEVQLRKYLENKFGKLWWKNNNTGDFLRSLYQNGRKTNAIDVLKSIGYEKIDPSHYLADIKKHLK